MQDKGIQEIQLESGATLTINFDKKLGEGSFGAVYAARYRSADGTKVDDNAAVKIPKDPTQEIEEQTKEVRINLLLGLMHEQCNIDGMLCMIMPNLGKEMKAGLPANKDITDTYDPQEYLATDTKGSTNKQRETKQESQILESQDEDAEIFRSFIANDDIEHTESAFLGEAKAQQVEESGSFVAHEDVEHTESAFLEGAKEGQGKEQQEIEEDDSEEFYGSQVFSKISEEEEKKQEEIYKKQAAQILKGPDDAAALQKMFLKGEQLNEETAKNGDKSPLDVPPRKEVELEGDFDEFSLNLPHTLEIFEKMAAEVERAHEHGVLHLDVKNENFLYDKATGKVKLIDFGVSEFINDNASKYTGGTPIYMPPELYVKKPVGKFSPEQDTYSLGRTYFFAIVNHLQELNPAALFEGPPINQSDVSLLPGIRMNLRNCPHLDNVQFKNPHDNPEISALNQLVALMQQMNQPNPANRPSLTAVRQQLSNIQSQLTLTQAQNSRYLDALKDQPFNGISVSDGYLAKLAIKEYNRRQEEEWNKKPANLRGEKPTPLPIPENDKLAMMTKEIREYQVAQRNEQETEKHAEQRAKKQVEHVEGEVQHVSLPEPPPLEKLASILALSSTEEGMVNEALMENDSPPFIHSANMAINHDHSSSIGVDRTINDKITPEPTTSPSAGAGTSSAPMSFREVIDFVEGSLNNLQKRNIEKQQQKGNILDSLMVKFDGVKSREMKQAIAITTDLRDFVLRLQGSKKLTEPQKFAVLESQLEETLVKYQGINKGNFKNPQTKVLEDACKRLLNAVRDNKPSAPKKSTNP